MSAVVLAAVTGEAHAAGLSAAEKASRSVPAVTSGLSGAEALDVAERAFPSLFDPEPYRPFRLRGDDRVERFLDDSTFLIDHGDGKTSLAESSLPARVADESGVMRLVDLQLEPAAVGWRPRNPLVPLEISPLADRGVRFPDGGFTVGLADAPARTAVSSAGGAFYPNVFADTDFLVSPRPVGAELAWQLRSQASPESYG